MNRLMQLITSIAFVLILSFPALAASDYSVAWEHGDLAGWHPNTIQTDLVVMETGGNPGGFLHSSRSPDETLEIGADCQLPEVTGDYGEAPIEEFPLILIFSVAISLWLISECGTMTRLITVGIFS